MAAGAPTPNLLDRLKATGASIMDALKSQYQAGPPQGAPSAGVGSVLDQKNMLLQQLSPSAQPLLTPEQALPLTPTVGAAQPQSQSSLTGLAGVKRK